VGLDAARNRHLVSDHLILPPELRETVDRLANWGLWARERRGAGRALSAEGRYRRPASDDDPRRTPTPVIDPWDAQRVDKALAPATGMPRRLSVILRDHYVFHADYRATCRRLAIQWQSYHPTLLQALRAADNRLAKNDRLR
jgi:hypothetical protein